MPSRRGMGSKIIRRWDSSSGVLAVNAIVPKRMDGRSAGQWMVESSTMSPSSAVCTLISNLMGAVAMRRVNSSNR